MVSARVVLFVLAHYVALFTVWGLFFSASRLPPPIPPCLCPPVLCPPCNNVIDPVPALEVTRSVDGRYCFTEHHILSHFHFNVSALLALGGIDNKKVAKQEVLV